MTPRVIPFHRPSIGDEEIAAVAEAMRSGWLTTGPVTAEFERQFAAYVGAPSAVAVNSCSSGLQLALAALGVGPGDEVITSPLTFCSTVHAIQHVGAAPVLADVGPDGNIDPASVAARVTSRTKAVLPVHLGGNPCRMGELWDLARKHKLPVVEDAAHALDSRYGNLHIGGDARSDAVVFSFYATKSLTTGDGGMVTTHRADLAGRMRVLGYHGTDRSVWQREREENNWRYEVVEAGFKFNLSDLQSAIGLEQLKKQEGFLAARCSYAQIYEDALAGIEEIELPAEATAPGNCWHLYRLALRCERLSITRDAFIREMKLRGVSCSVHFIPVQMHPFFATAAQKPENDCPSALALYPRLVSLPIYPAMSADDVRYVAQCVCEIIR